MIFHFRVFPRETNDRIFQKIKRTPSLAHFGHFSATILFLILTKLHCAKF